MADPKHHQLEVGSYFAYVIQVRNTIKTAVRRNKEVASSKTVFSEMLSAHFAGETAETSKRMQDHMENILDIR